MDALIDSGECFFVFLVQDRSWVVGIDLTDHNLFYLCGSGGLFRPAYAHRAEFASFDVAVVEEHLGIDASQRCDRVLRVKSACHHVPQSMEGATVNEQ